MGISKEEVQSINRIEVPREEYQRILADEQVRIFIPQAMKPAMGEYILLTNQWAPDNHIRVLIMIVSHPPIYDGGVLSTEVTVRRCPTTQRRPFVNRPAEVLERIG